jgi:Trp operon repressor
LKKQTTIQSKMTEKMKKGVNFSTPVEQVFWFEGVTEEERDAVWFRRTDYIEFVEAELRRRDLLSEIEKSKDQQTRGSFKGEQQKQQQQQQQQRLHEKVVEEAAMKVTFARKMASRTLSTGPPRRRRLPKREKNDLDVSNHETHQFAMAARAKRGKSTSPDLVTKHEPAPAIHPAPAAQRALAV